MTSEKEHGRVAGIDYGTVRIGIAVSDPERILASPYETYNRKTPERDAEYFRTLIREEKIVLFAVGLPVHLSGEESEKSREAMDFARWLHEVTEIPVAFVDERFTSVEAEKYLRGAKLTNKKRKERRDKIAAQILLSTFLESGGTSLEEIAAID